jgi:aminoglycoside phosphotransferase (APT) family kinase protein
VVHRCVVPDLPPWRESLEWSIRHTDALPDLMKQAALAALARMPDGDGLCHGDFHPDNIIMSSRGPVVIDWMTARRCAPLADVARSLVILRLGDPPAGTPGMWLINLLRNSFINTYLNRYRQLRSVARGDVDAWTLPVAAARLRENIPAEKSKLLKLIETSMPGAQ